MLSKITLFDLFNSKESHLSHISTISNNVKGSTSTDKRGQIQTLTLQPLNVPNNVATGINITPSRELKINKYSTLQLDYNIISYDCASDVKLELQHVINATKPGNDPSIIDSSYFIDTGTEELSQNNTSTIKNLHYFTESVSSFNINIFFTNTTSISGITIKDFKIHLLEGDQMVYDDLVIPRSYNQVEAQLYQDVLNESTTSYGFDPSGSHKKLFLHLPNIGSTTTELEDVSGIILTKEFTTIDHPDYTNGESGRGLYGLVDGLIDISDELISNTNINVPVGYNYLWQFIFNDMTYTNIPSLELTGVYGDFNNNEYYSPNNTYDTIVQDTGDYNTGKHIKLKIPNIDEYNIPYMDDRNDNNYILKKIKIIFIKFHNVMFNYFYNHTDVSGNPIYNNNPLIDHSHAPPIHTTGSNTHAVFEFLRQHTILHYQSMIINDLLDRYCNTDDVLSYLKENTCSNNSVTSQTLNIEFIELIRLMTQFDQNEIKLNNSYTVQKYDLYDRTLFRTFENNGSTVSGIMWGSLFKCMEQLPQYSKKMLPQIQVSNSSGDSLALNTSGIGNLNPFYYFTNVRLKENSIASGQQIRDLIVNGTGEKLCPIPEDLLKGNDSDNVLSNNNVLEFTPYIYYILYECAIYTRGRALSTNGVASNILLKNIFKCFYNSVTDYTKKYLNDNVPLIFGFNSGGIDQSGNVRIGNEYEDSFNMMTTSSIFMRDIIRATTSADPYHMQHYHVLNISNFFTEEWGEYVDNSDANGIFNLIYVTKDVYLKMEGFVGKIYTVFENQKFSLVGTEIEERKPIHTLYTAYKLRLEHNIPYVTLPNVSMKYVFFSNVL